MSKQVQFAEILEGKLRNQASTAQFDSSVRQEFDTDPAHLAYLMSQVQKLGTTPKRATTAYPRAIPRPLPAYILTPIEQKAAAYFQQWNEILNPRFTKSELKAAFRRLAKKLHPDLSLRAKELSGEEFMELKKAFDALVKVPKK